MKIDKRSKFKNKWKSRKKIKKKENERKNESENKKEKKRKEKKSTREQEREEILLVNGNWTEMVNLRIVIGWMQFWLSGKYLRKAFVDPLQTSIATVGPLAVWAVELVPVVGAVCYVCLLKHSIWNYGMSFLGKQLRRQEMKGSLKRNVLWTQSTDFLISFRFVKVTSWTVKLFDGFIIWFSSSVE